MGDRIRDWRIHLRNTTDLAGLAGWINPIVRGWMTYHSKYYRTALYPLLRRINTHLAGWVRRKFTPLRSFKRVLRWWNGLFTRQPRLFAHWAWMTEFERIR